MPDYSLYPIMAASQFMEAIKNGQVDLVREILQRRPGLGNATDDKGITAVLMAAYSHNEEMLRLVLSYKQNLDIFESAAIGDVTRIENNIRLSPCSVNDFSVDGYTPLGLACYFGHSDAARLLIDEGADVNLPSNNHMRVTPLHSACAIGHMEIARLLVENEADINAAQENGILPIHSAAHNGFNELLVFLLENGADVNAKADNGKTPMAFALERNLSETAALLLKYGAA